MYSFLVYASDHPGRGERILAQSAEITRSLMPSLGQEILSSFRLIDEINGGWFFLRPGSITHDHLVSEHVDDAAAVLVFGEAVERGDGSARVVADVWKQRGAAGVRNLDGCFSAVIVNRREQALYVVSDLMGRRTLRYWEGVGELLISPHDVAITATGLCPLDYDADSAASICVCGWSLQGKALLKGVEVCDPNDYVVWRHGRLEKIRKPLISVEDRIEAGDKAGIANQVDAIIEKLRDRARMLCADRTEIGVGLTAGFDSRTSLALLLSVVDPSCIRASTSGAAENFEVRTARRLARRYGFEHTFKMPEDQDVEAFVPHSRLLAFLTNGDTNSKRAIQRLPQIKDDPLVRFHGSGGEVFRSSSHLPMPLTPDALAHFLNIDPRVVLAGRYKGLVDLPWIDPVLAGHVRTRLEGAIDALGEISSNPCDILNLFYLFERYGRWASMVPRATWARGRYSLFDCPSAVKAAYRLPAPISNNCILHRTILRRYTADAYRWLVNEESFLPLMSRPRAYFLLRRVLRFRKRVAGKGRRVFGLDRNAVSSEAKWGEISARLLGPVMRDMILDKGSLACCVLSRPGLERILDEHISMRKNHLQLLGGLVTLEQWRTLMEEAAGAARRAEK